MANKAQAAFKHALGPFKETMKEPIQNTYQRVSQNETKLIVVINLNIKAHGVVMAIAGTIVIADRDHRKVDVAGTCHAKNVLDHALAELQFHAAIGIR